MTTTDNSDLPNDFKSNNEGANFWRIKKKVSTIPGKYKTKKPKVEWTDYEKVPPTKEQHNIWLNDGSYDGGVFIMPGPVLDANDNYSQNGPYVIGFDFDNQNAMLEFCKIFGRQSLSELAKITLVEQHLDAPYKGHAYTVVPFPFPNQPANRLGLEIKNSLNGIMRVAPSMTENGRRMEIIGTMEPKVLTIDDATEILQRLDKLFNDNGLGYLDKSKSKDGNGRITPTIRKMIKSLQITAEDKKQILIEEGYRHSTLVSIANSILINKLNKNKSNELVLHDFFIKINQTLCKPEGLPDWELADIWDSAVNWSADRILEQSESEDNTTATEEVNRKSKSKKGEEEFPERAEFLKALYDTITDKFTFKSMVDSGEILYYDEDEHFYKFNGEAKIKIEAERLWPDVFNRVVAGLSFADELDADLYPLTESEREELVKRIRYRTPVDRRGFEAVSDIINVKNGLLNIATRKLEQHNPHHLSIKQFPMIYDPAAKWTQILKFFKQVQNREGVNTLIKMFGYIMMSNTVKYQKAFFFAGRGDNGKSVVIDLIEAFVGEDNCSAVKLHDLKNDRFMAAQMYGKIVNTYADIPATPLEDVGTFKALVAGDKMTVQHKYGKLFDFRNRAKLIFSGNAIPLSDGEDDLAYFKRWVILFFEAIFKGEKADRDLLKKLSTPENLSALLNLALVGMELLKRDGFENIPIEVIRAEYERESVSLKSFLNEKCTVNLVKPEYYMVKDDFYNEYLDHWKENKLEDAEEALTAGKVEIELSKYKVFDKRITINKVKKTCYKGIITHKEADKRNQEILERQKQSTL